VVSEPPPDPLDAAWAALLAHWNDPERHGAFLALAASLDRLTDAAARYRAVESEPERAEGAARGRERLLALALTRLEAPRREGPARTGWWLLPIAAFALLAAASLLASQATGHRALVSPATLALEALLTALIPWRRLTR
jgi:hypothetical protein